MYIHMTIFNVIVGQIPVFWAVHHHFRVVDTPISFSFPSTESTTQMFFSPCPDDIPILSRSCIVISIHIPSGYD